MLSTNRIRKEFLDFFVKNDHTLVRSSSLIPHNDPSLMFVNSGMVQFKNVFTGVDTRDYRTATSSQKSVRAGGKHNDLDNVGYTARHHTFFEMLGNFSFGDYFKEKAIHYAWELLTKNFDLQKNKLYVTVYHTDSEAENLWKKISGLSDDRIIKISTNDNFWSMGDTGPCGPCSEIFYDHGDHIFGGLPGTKDQDGDRYVEIWNMVFMQYDQVDKETKLTLPKPCIDTGMGLERISAVMQGVHDNYEIDLFKDIISTSEELTKQKSIGNAKFSHRVIADHLRSSAFLIADGVMPSNEGRGYVLRRIMRRAMRHAHMLNAKEPLLYRLFPTLVHNMADTYNELNRAFDFITDVLKQEEERFKTTLDRGLKLLEDEVSLVTHNMLSGDVAFKLYDTYGFPLDLTEDILKSSNVTVDNEGFNAKMLEQKERAKKAWVGSGEAKTDKLWFELHAEHGSTEFIGYSLEESQGTVLEIIVNSKKEKKTSSTQDPITIITNQTPFYGESGGQMGDKGIIHTDYAMLRVIDTKKYCGSVIAHICILESGILKIGDIATLKIDIGHRNKIRSNHSATHILHSVLREVLGSHVTQKGSLVSSERLRFDISHPNAINAQQKRAIEEKVNSVIRHNFPVKTVLMSTSDAINQGAMALFGEKYDDEVRVVSVGEYSTELCGGTHVKSSGDIGAFKIISESAIAAGIRRIEAITGAAVIEYTNSLEDTLSEFEVILKTNRTDLLNKVQGLVEQNKNLSKELQELQKSIASLDKMQIENLATSSGAYQLLYKEFKNLDVKILRTVAEDAATLFENLVVIFVNKEDAKNGIICAISKGNKSIAANDLVQKIAQYVGLNGGGGSNTLAQIGGAFDLHKFDIKQFTLDTIANKSL